MSEIALVVFVALNAIGIWIRRPSSVVGGAAAISGAFSLCLGFGVLRYPGDTLRVLSPTLALPLAARIIGTHAASRAALPSPASSGSGS